MPLNVGYYKGRMNKGNPLEKGLKKVMGNGGMDGMGKDPGKGLSPKQMKKRMLGPVKGM